MDACIRKTLVAALIGAAAIAGAVAGCGERRPLTILFTGDEHGRLVPYG